MTAIVYAFIPNPKIIDIGKVKITVENATVIRQEILEFLKTYPEGKVKLKFDKYVGLTKEFCDELSKKLVTDTNFDWDKNGNKISCSNICPEDSVIAGQSIADGEVELAFNQAKAKSS